ncbi:MAG: cytochrome c1 [Gammaproteobacteria bacterium]|nr:cytochrome c1 [Gammaproteobacteria bacterium]
MMRSQTTRKNYRALGGALATAMATALTVTVTVLTVFASPALAATESKMQMTPFKASLKDTPSMQRGAKLFVNYCLSCHSAKFMRYNRMAEDLHIPPALVEKHMLFAAEKIGDPMETTMPADAAEEWFGVAPPDLSLIARLRGPEWLYNYFLTFYLDDNSPSGWNNVVFENVAMPHAMHELQGLQRAVFKTETAADGTQREVLERFEITSPGKMSVAEYRQAAADLTNFLVYLGEPAKLVRIEYGIWVMLFMLVFAGLAYMLKKEYWRDVE